MRDVRAKALLLLASAQFLAPAAADVPRPRGVGPDFARYYKSNEVFNCISNPSLQLPIAQLNDDYCDCPDGSDEPGTSACSYLSPLSPRTASDVDVAPSNSTLALPGYYCRNKGHQPSYVPFRNVNDGVCDYELCCDGSDEWSKVGGVSCPDRCKEIGKEWRAQDEARQRSMGAATKKRKELLAEAARLKMEVEGMVEDLKVQIEAAEVQVKDAEDNLAEVESRERNRMVRGASENGKVGVLAGLARARVEELRRSLEDVRGQRNAEREKVKELEAILSTFKEDYNPNFNDEGVKRAVRSWEEYAARDRADPADSAALEGDLDEIAKPDSETDGINWSEWEAPEEENDVEILYTVTAYLPPSLRTWADAKLQSLRELLISNGVIARPSSSTGTDSPAVSAARTALESARSAVASRTEKLNAHTADLAKDHGPAGIFRALKGRCVTKDSGEYTYELCWLDHTKQKSKKGGSETTLGNFVRFDTVTVDDEPAPDGRGLGSGERLALVYENGQHCWNGPSRSTLVVLGCSEDDELWKVTEEEKCVYRMEVGTSAVCGVDIRKEGTAAKDEL